jgi:NTE family protein
MTLNDVSPQELTAPRKDRAALPGDVELVMQVSGAPAANGRRLHEWHETGIEPDWVIGTSIGAINGAIIAGRSSRTETF